MLRDKIFIGGKKIMDREKERKMLHRRLKEVVDKFDALKNSGMDEEILKIYLKFKTKLSMSNIEKVLKTMDEFYNKLIKLELIEGLEK